jgi:hypothetical protein
VCQLRVRSLISERSIYPSMALQPLPGLGFLHKTPPFISIRSSSPPSSYSQQFLCIPLNHIRPYISWSSNWYCITERQNRAIQNVAHRHVSQHETLHCATSEIGMDYCFLLILRLEKNLSFYRQWYILHRLKHKYI